MISRALEVRATMKPRSRKMRPTLSTSASVITSSYVASFSSVSTPLPRFGGAIFGLGRDDVGYHAVGCCGVVVDSRRG
jgi:hypothetical protein